MIPDAKSDRLLPLLYIALFAVVALRCAWVTEDAYITFRTVDNFVNGYGLTWNTAERVQAYTHPLWMFLMSGAYLVTGDVYFTSIKLNLVLSVAALTILARHIGRSLGGVIMGLTVLTASKAFVDYSASGLENPLTHVLLAAFLAVYLRREAGTGRPLLLCLLAALIALNRMDAGLLVLPPLLFVLLKIPWREAIRVAPIGFSPLILWFGFALFYYGFPFPNTAYAKLNTGIPAIDLTVQGLYYLLNSVRTDPVTLAAVVGGITVALIRPRRADLPIVAGILLSLIYVVRIGGDFMSGRFLTAPLFCSALLMVRCGPGLARIWPAAAVCAVAIGFFAPHPTVLAGRAYGDGFEGLIDTHGIADERGCYFPHAGLFSATGQRVVDHHFAQRGIRIREAGRFVVQEGNIGYTGYYAGPKAHLVNGFALTDPLLARLPVRGPNWRIGHFVRDLPHGYVETLRTGENRLRDGSIARYHDILSLVVRGELWDAGRLAAILRLNIGAHDHLTRDRFEACREHMAGSHLAYDGDWKAARAALTRAVELDSMRSAAWYLLSFAHRSSGDLDLAWRAIARSHALRPGDKGIGAAHLKVGDLYLEQGKTSEAASVYLGAARREPSDTRAWLRLGASLRKLERWREAADALAVAMALDSTRTGVWTDLAEARRLAGDLQGAAQAALSGLSRGSTDIRVWSEYLTIGSTYHSGGEVDSALAIYEAVVASAPELTDVHVNLGILHFGEGRYEASAASFEKAIARSPDDAGGHMGLAEALEQLGRTEEAVASYRRGLSIEPDNEAARAGLRRLTGLE